METKIICANCEKEIELGIDAFEVKEGVTGLKGFIPLEDSLFFCCERCIKEYFDISDLPSMPGRFP